MCVVVLGLGATSAFANTSVTINGGTLEVTGGDDGGFPVATPDANAITVSHDRLLQQFTVSDVNQVDAVQNSTGTVPCQQTSMTTVTCPDGAVTGIAVDTNGGNDSAT